MVLVNISDKQTPGVPRQSNALRAGLLPSRLTGAWVGNRRFAFKINVPRLTLRDEPLVTEQQRGTFAKPGLELRVEGEGVEQGPSLRRVVFRAIEDGPPAPPGARYNFSQSLARIAVRDNLDGIKARGLQSIEKSFNVPLPRGNRISEDRVSGDRSEGQEDPAQLFDGDKSLLGLAHEARSGRLVWHEGRFAVRRRQLPAAEQLHNNSL